MIDKKFFSPNEVAEKLSLSPNTIRRWIKEGKLKATKIGRQWRITEQDVQEILEDER